MARPRPAGRSCTSPGPPPARGVRVAVITVAGPEPEAQAALASCAGSPSRLSRPTPTRPRPSSIATRAGGRRLALERRGGRVELAGSALRRGAGGRPGRARRRRGLDRRARAPGAVPAARRDPAGLAAHASTRAPRCGRCRCPALDPRPGRRAEPVRPAGGQPRGPAGRGSANRAEQLAALRRPSAPGPRSCVTDGVRRLWLRPSAHAPPSGPAAGRWASRRVGAGDILAAFMAIEPRSRRPRLRAASARDAMRVVAEVLEERR